VRITKAALALARELGIDLSALPVGPIITERDLRARAGGPQARAAAAAAPTESPFVSPVMLDNRIVIYGGGGHGRSLLDLLARDTRYRVAGVIDDELTPGTRVGSLAVLGPRSALAELAAEGVRLAANGVGGVRSIADRVDAFRALAEAGFAFPALVHRAAIVEGSAAIEDGAQILANAYVGSACRVARGAIVNTAAVLSHDCVVGEYAHVAPAAVLAGGVDVGARTLVGMGVLVALGVRIGADARIGNGAIVNADVQSGAVVAAGTTWPRR
jgi:sugar O-acyltransferase (sialic acid O-acetyltransferase NeuD family)